MSTLGLPFREIWLVLRVCIVSSYKTMFKVDSETVSEVFGVICLTTSATRGYAARWFGRKGCQIIGKLGRRLRDSPDEAE